MLLSCKIWGALYCFFSQSVPASLPVLALSPYIFDSKCESSVVIGNTKQRGSYLGVKGQSGTSLDR
nr:hypothetical protein Q903MT_gene1661 [Picea sitchensis]